MHGGTPATDPDFDAFFNHEYEAIVRTVTHIVRDREVAREIAQEAFVKAYTRWWRVSRYDKPGAWVRRIAIRMAVRSEQRRRLLERALKDRAATEPPRAVALDVDVYGALERLSPRQRASVALFYLEDRPVAEIAVILECSESTVKVHLHKGRAALKNLVGRSDDDDG